MKALGIDGRASREFPSRAFLSEELISQLSADSSSAGGSCCDVAEHAVLISHPKQSAPSELARISTKFRIRHSPLNWFWERKLVRSGAIGTLHRFRPVDRVSPVHSVSTITTLLPAIRRLPLFFPKTLAQHYVVPSESDATLLERRYRVPRRQVSVVYPSIRSAVQNETWDEFEEGCFLFLVGHSEQNVSLGKLLKVVADRFPATRQRVLRLDRRGLPPVSQWLKLLKQTKVCFYLATGPFDWATLFLESLYVGIPTLFSDGHAALRELLPGSPLRLNRFLVEQPEVTALRSHSLDARDALTAKGIMDASLLSRQYIEIYRRFIPTQG